MPDAEGYQFRRIRVPVGNQEIWIEWDDRGDGKAPVPFTVWAPSSLGGAGSIDVRVVNEGEIVGWRRDPDPASGPGEDGSGTAASGPGPEQRA